jgi:hypothetical protein
MALKPFNPRADGWGSVKTGGVRGIMPWLRSDLERDKAVRMFFWLVE